MLFKISYGMTFFLPRDSLCQGSPDGSNLKSVPRVKHPEIIIIVGG